MEVLLTEAQKETEQEAYRVRLILYSVSSFKKIEVLCSLSGPLFAMATGHLRVCSR